ncbi:3-oxoacyl-[acyl-carrier-protein] reductase FabG [Nitrospira sp. KM1]|uniref:SDR family oxidoreductase n=1 Tax=Nitrospira sp. KM1 TaxID=1936990 RepID=UPI0013A76684|nr:SDR family NAD(P)-dependent oxidoreductase [Nitrospira sp. KM1]BCA55259.1 3-oxoacyl-[acyl-carrier-protein] reductase FabG [Nitrospira sp. KM1]
MKNDKRVIVIAGAAGGLGRTVVPAFTGTGTHVVALNRSGPPSVSEASSSVQVDVTDESDVRRAVNDIIKKTGRIDVMINLVGGFAVGRVVDTDASLWQRMLAMNLTSAFLLSKAVLPHMVDRGSGRIVHVAAWAAVEPFPGAAAYIVAKSGLLALINVMALETKGSGVTVNGVLPATIDTPANRTNMPEADPSSWTKPESIAGTLLFLASEAADQISGATIPVGTRIGGKQAARER